MLREGYTPDDAQWHVVGKLDDISRSLVNGHHRGNGFGRLFRSKPEAVRGLYLWGGVGRGKTFLMDAFYKELPISQKYRLHFHRFMILVHERLHELKRVPNALETVARDYAANYRVLCLDEMHITDEGDAAIREGLLINMIAQGMTLIMTSNRSPEGLTDDPYIERLFRRAATMLQSHLDVINMDSGIDYRLRHINQAEIWHSPLDQRAENALEQAFHECSAVELHKEDFIIINQRPVPVVKWADGVAWFDFGVICGPPRARIDYIEIARFFHSVLIRNVPVMNDENNDYARRFTQLIDELYDHNVKLFVTSMVEVDQLYQGTRLAFEFQRTSSRLQEMQSHEYLAREHDS